MGNLVNDKYIDDEKDYLEKEEMENKTAEKKYTIQLTRSELAILTNILDHFADYVSGDDRIDHGWNVLKSWRDNLQETKTQLYILTGKLKRRLRK